MRWVAARILWPLIWTLRIISSSVRLIFRLPGCAFEFIGRRINRVATAAGKFAEEVVRMRGEALTVARDIRAFAAEEATARPLDPNKKTVFLLITCGQAVRNFLVSDVFDFLRARFNVVLLSPYAYSEDFRREYSRPGVHVLPWFTSFRTMFERVFQYYFMGKSRSRTHHSWLANLEMRAKTLDSGGLRYRRLMLMRRLGDLLGGALGWRGVQGLYGSYFMAFVPQSLFSYLFPTYRPAVVVSTTAQHPEAWPLTYFARRHGVKTIANILSWDNTTTKPVMDIACDYYTVWSEGMTEELAYQFPHIKTEAIITGCPLFDMYSDKRYAVDRATFLTEVGLAPDKPYILYTTNTPAGMPDECEIVRKYWRALQRSPLAGKVSLLVRLHPKESIERYSALLDTPDVAVTLAAQPHWENSDRWLPSHADMRLLLNSMMHAAVSVNVASTMSLESFALGLPTINVGFRSSDDIKDHGSMWSFDMYHFSEHYHALVENGAVALARNVDELVAMTMDALEQPDRRAAAMRQTLRLKAAYNDGTSARRFVDVVEAIVQSATEPQTARELAASLAQEALVPPVRHAVAAE